MEQQRGQTLIEMIIIVGVIVLLATGIVAGTTAALSRSETLQARSEALSQAQAGIELARGLRDNGWNTFATKGTPATTYCVGSGGGFVTGTCMPPYIDNRFKRYVTLELTTIGSPPTPTMKVTSKVVWDPSNAVQLSTYLTQWK
jgi:type II secretory pathway pseudopilin PulG